jgi:nucleotide-binding universal stress UspA family protein
MFKKIVVGYAGDRAGRDGVALACQMAALGGAEMTVVYPYHPLLASAGSDSAEAAARDELEAMRGDDPVLAAAIFHWSNASWPIRALHELASYEAADLIVMGAVPERPERQHISLMERMVHGAPCAVAVAPDGYADRTAAVMKEIGVGFADSVEGRAAIALGCELARLTRARLRIIAAAGLSATLGGYASLVTSVSTVEDELFQGTKARLESVAADLEVGDSTPDLQVGRGDACRLLLDASRELDLLILGSRGYGPLRHVLLGSVSAPVMRSAHCPVLVLPRRAAEAGHAATIEATVTER